MSYALPYHQLVLRCWRPMPPDARRHETDLRQAAQLRRQAAKLHNIGVNSGSDLLTIKTRQLRDRAERIEAAARTPAATVQSRSDPPSGSGHGRQGVAGLR